MTITYNGTPDDLLTYTSPSLKLCRQSDGLYKYQAHNLYLNSAAPANQSITVVSGATYAVTITGTVSTTASGAATGTWTAGTQTFTAATTTLTFGSTSGAGTVHVRRTPSVDTYIATTGAAKYALPYEWDSSGNPLGILVEEARTNLWTRSFDIGDAVWTVEGVTAASVTPTAAFSSARRLTEDTSTGSHRLYRSFSGTGSQVYALSKHVRLQSGTRSAFIIFQNAGNTIYARYNLQTGVVISSGASGTGSLTQAQIVNAGGGWYRLILVGSPDTASATYFAQLYLENSPGTGSTPASYTGDGTSAIDVQAFQLEAGSFATSPIETFGATATRAIDKITLATSSYPTATSTTVYARAALIKNGVGGTNRLIGTNGASSRAFLVYNSATSIAIWNGAQYLATSTGSGNIATGSAKAAVAGDGSSMSLVFGGGTVATNANPITNTFTSLSFGSSAAIDSVLNGYLQEVLVLPRRMTNTELQELTA